MNNPIFRNAKKIQPSSNWSNVDAYLHTWGYLPGDTSVLSKIPVEVKNSILEMALDTIWRDVDPKTFEMYVTNIQKTLEPYVTKT